MYKQLLKSIAEEINMMALLPLILFVSIFTLVVIAVIFEKKKHIDYMSQLPLEDQNHFVSKSNNEL